MQGRDNLARVSVIIPTYNRSDMLKLTLESVLTQTYPNIEIIVVDDGSTDDTDMVMAQYADRVTYIKQANQGVGSARNIGFLSASGKYINFFDHDDLMMPTKIERQVQVLDARPEISLINCGYYNIDKDGNRLDKVGFLPEGDVLRELVVGCFVWSGGPLIRRQCLDQVGLYDEESWIPDWDMWLRIALAGYQIPCIQEPLGSYRILPDSGFADVAKMEHNSRAILDKVFANPQLPADVAAMKEEVYGKMPFYYSCRYYAAGSRDKAQRNLTEALTLRPQPLEHPKDFLGPLCSYALDPRVSDPVKFIVDVFEHLPPCANGLERHRSHTLSRVYARLALRHYAVGNIAEAKHQLTEAIALDPTILKQPNTFADLICYQAMRLPSGEPALYVDSVLRDLPVEAQQLEHVRSRIMDTFNQVYTGLILRYYAVGNIIEARRQFAKAVALYPTILERPEAFAEAVCHYALSLPSGEPVIFVDTVLQNLPPEAQRLERVRARILSGINIACAFRHYAAGRPQQTIYHALMGIRYHLSWFRNRGVVSILLRSFLKMAFGGTKVVA